MNNLQPYEKHLADKLGQVPVPDKNEGWIEMRKLLDRDMPEGGGGWGGNRKWWWMGLTVAIIIAGLWTSQQFNDRQRAGSQAGFAGTDENVTNKPSTPINNETNAVANEVNSTTDNTNTGSNAEKSNNTNEPAVTKNRSDNSNSNERKEPGSNKNSLTKGPATTVSVSKSKNNSQLVDLNVSPTGNGNQYSRLVNNKNSGNVGVRNAGASKANNAAILLAGKEKNSNGVVSDMFNAGNNNDPIANAQGAKVYKSPEENAFLSSYTIPSGLVEQTFENPEDKFIDLPSEKQPLKAEPGKTDKAFTKDMRKKSIPEDNRKMSRRNMRGIGAEKDRDLTFAAGLSMPQSFAIGGQQSPAYGVNAKSGKASDYVPVPFFQYHINNRLFFQTELQFQSPQFTDRLLISQTQHTISPANGMLERSIYVEKLYYFNIPLNIYFSPARNFYFGSGIQFSSLLSGVATYQDNRYTNGTLDNSYSRVQGFKDDSVAAKLAPSEWRYQLEGNYYFKRFTFGARYNQALKQFVNLQPSPTLPLTQGRNQSFLIYLRYNIWEERKKNMYSLAGN